MINNLKNKIIKEIKKELEFNIIKKLKHLDEEKKIHLSKGGDEKINRFNFLKIQYKNLKNKDINIKSFISNSLVLLVPLAIINFILFSTILTNPEEKFSGLLLINSIFLLFTTLMSEIISGGKTIARKEFEYVNEKINKTESSYNFLKNNISEIFNNNKCLEYNYEEDIDIFNQPISVKILENIKHDLSEEQIISLLKKTGTDKITYKKLIEFIKEEDETINAKKFYKNIFNDENIGNKKESTFTIKNEVKYRVFV